MPREIQSGPGALLQRARFELGRSLEEDRSRARVLTDMDMHLMIERGMRGSISMVSKKYAKANNPRVEGYNPTQLTKYITYLDANNL